MSTEIGYEGSMFGFGSGHETGWETGPFEFSQEVNNESALIGELLEVTSDEELDQFLGKLARSVVKGATSFVRSPIGQAVGGVLRSVAKKALPMVGGALGSMVLPGVGTALGSKLGSMAGTLLEEEEVAMLGEGVAEEEAARRFIRFAGATYRNAARTPRYVPPRAAALAASVAAARVYAPSLLRPPRSSGWRGRRRGYPAYDDAGNDDTGWADQGGDTYAGSGATTGRWIRQGNRVTLIGL